MKGNRKALLVGVNIKQQADFSYSMKELANLAAACHIDSVAEVTQNLNRINKTHYIGTGKIEETLRFLEELDAELVIFNDELSATQIRNLEQELGKTVIDRTMLILDIFASRAKTREAQLQVEVAHLKYMLPRITGQRESLGRQGGGVGLKNRGAGETKLELDRRKIEAKIVVLNKELEALVAQRETQRNQRKKSGVPLVSLVGYTNAGKSTILNALLRRSHQSFNKQVFEKDMLFATLDTSVRKIKLANHQPFLLSDTVGFVDKLPHHLVKAFRSTLEEAATADLLIVVVDFSSPNYQKLVDVTNKTLKDIGIENVPMIYAYNKADLVDIEIPQLKGESLYLSAKQEVGIEELAELIGERVFKNKIHCDMLIPFDGGRLVSYLNENANVLATSYDDNGTKLTVECNQNDFEKYQQYVI
ncbi:GTPase HflX [Neobacillus vireti]|uniref:GTPase HflX n=1 Tax=Neobacillus vireti LMG 21834 TaxID=1131730 RepID=A0AB94INQ9_9BACI|nr:GTPase HflX [Neobacillus vireti]ETI68603.1 GTP-binding protein [Neobacillus vireti LMG 21834]KLT18829.1 GTP-binding protein [Neobacillus vireti]